jgi:hypothetical protein
VPEAPVDLNDRAVLGKNEIGPTWQVRSVKTISKALGVKISPDPQLRASVFPADSRHHSTASLAVDDIGHVAS